MNNTAQTRDALTLISRRKQLLSKEIEASRGRMSELMHEIVAPAPKARNKAQGISQLVSNGMAIYEGIRIGMSIISAFRTLFGKRRHRR